MTSGRSEKPPHDMTIAELQAEIAMLQGILHFKVCGDPRVSVTVVPTHHEAIVVNFDTNLPQNTFKAVHE